MGGGVAALVCDATENTVRQDLSRDGGGISVGSLSSNIIQNQDLFHDENLQAWPH